MLAEALAAAALICLDPGHGTPPAIGRQREPIGPGSPIMKIKDGGGAQGESEAVLAIARRTRTLLLRRGYRVAMTRTGSTFRGGNIERARFCNRRGAALMLRIHADGSSDTSRRGASTLFPARRTGWTDDVYGRSRRAARAIQGALVGCDRRAEPRARGTLRPDRLQLGRRSRRPRRDRVHDEPDRGPPPPDERLPVARRARARRWRCGVHVPLEPRIFSAAARPSA